MVFAKDNKTLQMFKNKFTFLNKLKKEFSHYLMKLK
jgi:hypothetical protein